MASLDHEMTVYLDAKPSPAMREFARTIVRETLRQAEDTALIRSASHSDDLAKQLEGHIVKIAGSTLSGHKTKVMLADTGKEIPNIRRIELVLDAQTDTMTARLYRWKLHDETALEYAETSKLQVVTQAVVEAVPDA